MQGKRVIVRDFIGRPLERIIWEVAKGAVFITNDEQFKKLIKGAEDALLPIGFPPEDVFEYDPPWMEALQESAGEEPDWSKLKLLIGSN
ncbi:MAG: hypothetical protein IH975_05550 [Nitrospinae bacterium]|nr:hypothetical protein [Nitrospinota bacterium]